MSNHTIPDSDALHREIMASYERCQQYGVDPLVTCNLGQIHLSSEALTLRRKQNKDFLEVATVQLQELYQVIASSGFVVSITDNEGYILHMIGGPLILERLATGNGIPGYRWTEKDVGTSAISMALARETPI